MSKFLLDKQVRNEMIKEVQLAINEVEEDIINTIRKHPGTLRDTELNQLDVLNAVAERVIARLQ